MCPFTERIFNCFCYKGKSKVVPVLFFAHLLKEYLIVSAIQRATH